MKQPPFPTEGRLLGIDYGSKRLGVAVSDAEQRIAGPLENYTRSADAADAEYLKRVVTDYQVAGLVVGLPVHMSGEEGEKAREARRFGEWAARVTELPVRFWDERHTSAQAEEHLREAKLTKKQRQARRDKLAAHIILQSFLDTPDRDQPPVPWDR